MLWWLRHNANRCWNFDPSVELEVRYPHNRHSNAGRSSNSAKTSIMQDFLDMNSQPNGRSADSTGPTHYCLPKFTTIQMPKSGVPHYEHVQRSLVGEFNRAQRERGRGECSNSSSHNWLKQRPKVAICPRQTDYCDTCKKRNIEIDGSQTTLILRSRRSRWDYCPQVISRESPAGSTESSFLLHRSD